jgi:hypothetical protein
MKKLSLWGKNHVWPARIIIVSSILLLTVLAVVTGLLLRDLQVIFPVVGLLFFALLYAIGFILYPLKKNRGTGKARTSYYRRQKTGDLLLVSSSFLMIVYLGNHPRQVFNYSSPFSAAIAATTSLPKDSSLKTYKPIAAFKASMKDENGKLLKWKERKKLLKEQIRAIRHSNEPTDGGKVALIVLSVLVAMGLIALIAFLACEISCSGSAALAVIVAIGGTALVVFLLIRVIRGILGKKKKQIKSPENQPGGG